MQYQFGNITIDTKNYRILVNGDITPVKPQVFNLIVYLIENHHRLVTKEEIHANIWSGRIVSDTSISTHIKSARKILGDDGKKQKIIKTYHARGYQFVATFKETVSDKQEIVSQALKTIVVLPFTNIKPNPQTDYLSFALASQIINDLAYLQNFNIIPASMIREFINSKANPTEIAKELNAENVVYGNYLIENDAIRVNFEIIDTQSQKVISQEQIEDRHSNTFELQDCVSTSVITAFNGQSKGKVSNPSRVRNIPKSALAFEYYLRAISYPYTNEGHHLAIEMLKKSLDLDDSFAPSYPHLGNHIRLLEQHGRISSENNQSTEWYYQKALELNPELVEALMNLALYYTETGKLEEAYFIARRMFKINPNCAEFHFILGYIFRYAGMVDEAIEEMETALKLSPDNKRYRSIISTYIGAGKYQQALEKTYLGDEVYADIFSGQITFIQGRKEQARKHFENALKADSHGLSGLVATVYLAVLDNNLLIGKESLEKIVDTKIIDAENMFYFAGFYALLSEQEKCLELLNKAVDCGYYNYIHIQTTPNLNSVKHSDKYQEILAKAKKGSESFKKTVRANPVQSNS